MEKPEIIAALVKAGDKGLSRAALVGKSAKAEPPALAELKASGDVRGPIAIGKSLRYFVAAHAPSPERVAARIEAILRDTGTRLVSRVALEKKINAKPEVLFGDAIGLLKSNATVIELVSGHTRFYVHRDTVLEHVRSLEPSVSPTLTVEKVLKAYRTVKAEQGGISAVRIYDLLQAVGGPKGVLHKILREEARAGRASLHPTSTVNFPPEVIDAGIQLEGEPHPFVTVVIRDPT